MADQQQHDSQHEMPGGQSQNSDSAIAGMRLQPGGETAAESVLTMEGGGTKMLPGNDAAPEDPEFQKGGDMAQGTLSLDEVQRLEEIVEAERMGQKLSFMDQKYESRVSQELQIRAVPTFGMQNSVTNQANAIQKPAHTGQQLPRRDIFSFAPLNQSANVPNVVNTLPLSELAGGQIIKGSMVNPPNRFTSKDNYADGGQTPSKFAGQKSQRKGQSETTYHQLVKAQKLAVSTKRQVDITDKLHSNHIKMSESQQTYNPYHLSSYNAQQPTDKSTNVGGVSNGYHYRGIPIRDGLMADGMILHEQEATSEVPSPGARKMSDQRNFANTTYNLIPSKQKSAMNYSSEIRKQSKKKQEMVQKFRTQKRGDKDQPSNRQQLKHIGKSPESLPSNQPNQRIFGVQGERAQFNHANYALQIGREQMNEIAQMQEELEKNLKRLQHQKECQAHRGKNKYFGPKWEKDSRQTVYRMDPSVEKEIARPPKSHLAGYAAVNNRIGLKRIARAQGGKSLGSYEDQAMSLGLGRTSSHASSHQRKIEAQRALQTFVIKEHMSPNDQSTHRDGTGTKVAATGEPGSPTNPLKVPTVHSMAGNSNPKGATDVVFGFEMANQTATSGASGELKIQRGLDLVKENKMRQLGLEKSGNKNAPSFSEQKIFTGQRQVEDEYQIITGSQQRKPEERIDKTMDSRKSKIQNESQLHSTSSMQIGLPRQSGYSRKRSSGQGSCKLQAIGNMNDKQWYTAISEGQKEPDVTSQIQDQSANGQRQAIYSSYNLQRIDKTSKMPKSTENTHTHTNTNINVNKSQRNVQRQSKQQPAKLISMKSDMDVKNRTEKSIEPVKDINATTKANEESNVTKKRQTSQITGHRDSLISMVKATEPGQKNQPDAVQVDATVEIDIFDKSKKLDKTISPEYKIASMSPEGDISSKIEEKAEGKSRNHEKELQTEQKDSSQANDNNQLMTPQPIQATVNLESEATLQAKSPERSSPIPTGGEMNGTKLLADALKGSPEKSDSKMTQKTRDAQDLQEGSSKVNDGTKLRQRPTEDTLAFSDFRVKSQERGLTLEPKKVGGPTIFEVNQEEQHNQQSETTEIMVLSGGTNTGLLRGDLMVKGAKLGAYNQLYNDALAETPLAREAAVTNAASTSLFNQGKLNTHLLNSGTGLKAVNTNIRSQDQLRARRAQRRLPDYGTRAVQVKTGMSSQIHIHDHIINKSQGRGTNFVDALMRGHMGYGHHPTITVQSHTKARKMLASQGRSGGANRTQKWPTVLIAVKTDDRYLGRDQISSNNKEFGEDFHHLFGQQSDQLRNVKSSKDALYFNDDHYFVEDHIGPQRELRQLLDVKDRKKVQFRPAPSRIGLKFKNKSEEERYMKVVTKILQMEHMSKPQIENTLVMIRKFLREYLQQIIHRTNSPMQQRRQSEAEYDDPVEQWMISKFIKVIKGKNVQESTLSDGGQNTQKNYAGMSRLSADVPSKFSPPHGDVKASAGYQTGMGMGQTPVGFSEEFQQVNQGQNQRPITQGRQRTNQQSLMRNDGSQIESPRPEQPHQMGTKGISIQNFIRKIFGLKKGGNTLKNRGAISGENRSLSPSKYEGEVIGQRESDVNSLNTGIKADDQRNWGNQSHNDLNLSSGAEDGPVKIQDDEMSTGSEKTWERWDHKKIFPNEKWSDPKKVDPSQIYDGRRRDGCRPLQIPSTLLHRNYHLDQYIDNHTKHGQYETLLQTVLTSAYYSLKQQNHTDQTILNRLQSKNMIKSLMQRDNLPIPVRQVHTQPHQLLAQNAAEEQSKFGPGGSMASQQASRSQAMTIATQIHQTGITQANFSRDYSAAILNESPNHGFVMHDPSDQPLANDKITLDAMHKEESQRPGHLADQHSKYPSIIQAPGTTKFQNHRERMQSMGTKIRSANQAQNGFSVLRGGEDSTTQTLKNQSVIRRNGLMLEHIMRQRGQQDAESQVLAELYEELRNIEKREGTYNYKGATLMPGQKGEPKQLQQNKYLLVQVRRQNAHQE